MNRKNIIYSKISHEISTKICISATILFAASVLITGCAKSEDTSVGIDQFVGEWDCAESALEAPDSYTGFYALSIDEDGEFSLYDQEAGNPGIAGSLTVDSDSEITLKCQEEDFDPPAGWSEMSETQTLQYEFENDEELHLIYTDEGETWTLVFYKE